MLYHQFCFGKDEHKVLLTYFFLLAEPY